MTKKELIEKINSVKNARLQRNTIYEVLDELGVSYNKTNCSRCLNDLLLIAKEELGLINSAAEESSFNETEHNCGWRYIVDRPVFWGGYRIDQDTPEDVVEKFIEKHPKGYYERIPCPEEPTETQEPEVIGEFEGHEVGYHPDTI